MEMLARIEATGPLLAKGPQVVQQHLERFVDLATLFLLREVKTRLGQGRQRRGVGVGGEAGLRGSIQRDVTGKGTALVKGVVASALPYAEVVEKGRTAGKAWPPPKVLLPWIEQKLGLDPKAAARVEFLIRRKIGQKGFEGLHMFERALTANWGRLQTMAQAEGLAIVAELNG